MKVEPFGDPKKRRCIRGVIQLFEIQVKDRPARTVIATARTEEDLEGVQLGIEAWLASRGVLNDLVDPTSRSRIFPDGGLYSDFSRAFIDRILEVEEEWKGRHVNVWGLSRAARQR